MSPLLQDCKATAIPQCNGVLNPYAPFRELGVTPALRPVDCKGTAMPTAIRNPHVAITPPPRARAVLRSSTRQVDG